MATAKLGLIVATTKEGHIGFQNDIPWKIKGDLANFRHLTMSQAIIYGRFTYESLNCKPLPGRVNIVVTSQEGIQDEDNDLYQAASLEEAIELARRFGTDWIYFIGGSRIYAEALPLVEKAHVTLVHKDGVYDTTIPNFTFPVSQWSLEPDPVTVLDDIDPQTGFPSPSHTYLVYSRK